MGHQTWGFDTTAERLGGHFRTQTKLKRVQKWYDVIYEQCLISYIGGQNGSPIENSWSESCLCKLIKINGVILEVKLKGLM